MRVELSNKPDAVNPAITSQSHSLYHWRGVTDPERSAIYQFVWWRSDVNEAVQRSRE